MAGVSANQPKVTTREYSRDVLVAKANVINVATVASQARVTIRSSTWNRSTRHGR